MAGVRFADVQSRPAEFLNLTSLTLEEFQVLVAPFEAAFQDHMAAWRLDGKPRTARRFTVYRTLYRAATDKIPGILRIQVTPISAIMPMKASTLRARCRMVCAMDLKPGGVRISDSVN